MFDAVARGGRTTRPRSVLAWFGIDTVRPASAQRLVWYIAIALTAGALLVSLLDVMMCAGIDFRNRVVGARLLWRGEDPYTFHWQPGDPPELMDPVCDNPKTPRLTAPPTVLCLYMPFANLPYRVQRFISWGLEWLALGLSILFLTRTVPGHGNRFLFLAGAVLFFVFSDCWRLHVERGQVYVFHLLPLSIGVFFCLKRNLDSWMAGVAFGFAAALRLNLILLAPVFFALTKVRTATAMLVSFTAFVLATLPWAPASTWRSYLDVGNLYYLATWSPESLPDLLRPPVPATLEDYDFHRHLRGIYSTSFPVLYQKWRPVAGWPVVDLGLASKGAILLVELVLLSLLLLGRNRLLSPRLVLSLAMTFMVLIEYFLPQRWAYVDIMFLLPLALLTPALQASFRLGSPLALMVLLGLLASHGMFLHHNLYQATLLRSCLLLFGLTGLALVLWNNRLQKSRTRESPT